MTEYIPIICFVAGLAVGVAVTIIGFRLGFKASYEIRDGKQYPETEDKGLFKGRKDPAEFQILDEEDKERKTE